MIEVLRLPSIQRSHCLCETGLAHVAHVKLLTQTSIARLLYSSPLTITTPSYLPASITHVNVATPAASMNTPKTTREESSRDSTASAQLLGRSYSPASSNPTFLCTTSIEIENLEQRRRQELERERERERSSSPCEEIVNRTLSKQRASNITSPVARRLLSEHRPRSRSLTPDRRVAESHVRPPTQQEIDNPSSIAAFIARFPMPLGHRRIRSDFHVSYIESPSCQSTTTAHLSTATPPRAQVTTQTLTTPPNQVQPSPHCGPWSLANPPRAPVKGRGRISRQRKGLLI
jgi:hypothetical protein